MYSMQDEIITKIAQTNNTLFNKKIFRPTMWGIKSKNHNLSTYETNKRYLSCFDDKRYILKNRINTLAYGHKDI